MKVEYKCGHQLGGGADRCPTRWAIYIHQSAGLPRSSGPLNSIERFPHGRIFREN